MLESEANIAVECFADSLADLTVNSKPLINFLTMVAKENVKHAEAIVGVVDSHLKKAPSIVKLPILYLIDSILKNVATEYINLFSSVIKESFAAIYKESDIIMRQSMLKLRQTWNGIIPSGDLCAIDIDIHSFDSSWVLEGESLDTFKKIPRKILLNPLFLPMEPKEAEVEETVLDEAEMLREQLLLQKQKRELLKKQVDQQAPELLSNASQADSTTVENLADHKVEDSLKTQALSTEKCKTSSHELIHLFTDLVSRQNSESMKGSEDPDQEQKILSLKNPNKPYRRHSSYDNDNRRKSARSSGYFDHRAYRDQDYRNRKYRNKYRKQRYSDSDAVVCERKKPDREISPASTSSLISFEKNLEESSKHEMLHCSGTLSNDASLKVCTSENPITDLKNDIQTTAREGCGEERVGGSFLRIHNSLKQKYVPANIGCDNVTDSASSYIVVSSTMITRGKYKTPLLPDPPIDSGSVVSWKSSSTIHKFSNQNVPSSEKSFEITQEKIYDYKHGYGRPEKVLKNSPSFYPTDNLEMHFNQSLNTRLLDLNANTKYSVQSLPPACMLTLRSISQDPMGTISVDGISQDVRYYGQTAVIGAGSDNPREILFKPGYTSIILNNFVVDCAFHEPNKEIMLMGKCFRLRLGAPTREVYINDEGFQCAFNYPPKEIQLSTGEILSVRLQCSAVPLVHIGALRRDLVSGSVTLFVNGVNISCIFLDGKPQRFDIAGVPHVLRFVNCFKTTLINGQIVDLCFGGPAVALSVNGEVYYLQLSNLPPGLVLGQFSVLGMGFVPERRNPIPSKSGNIGNNPNFSKEPASFFKVKQTERRAKGKVKNKHLKTNLKAKTNAHFQHSSKVREQTDLPDTLLSKPPVTLGLSSGVAFEPCPNIHSLFKNLCDVGLLTPPKSQTELAESKTNSTIVEVDFSERSSLKVKQPGLVNVLYSGAQCNSCGERFIPDESGTYRKHLDWHFQINHEIRKPQSRMWFHNVKHWINFEPGINMVEEAALKTSRDQSSTQEGSSFSVPSHDFPPEIACEVCRDKFDEYFNEEHDEWHLKDCICNEGLVYHPTCLKDFQMTSDAAVHKRLQLLEDDLSKESLHPEDKPVSVLPINLKSSSVVQDNECKKEVLSKNSVKSNFSMGESCCLSKGVEISESLFPDFEIQSKDTTADTQTDLISCQHKMPGNLTQVDETRQNVFLDTSDVIKSEHNSSKESKNTVTHIPDSEPVFTVSTALPKTVSSEQETCGMLKSKLKGRKLTVLPPLVKGSDTSNMCTVT